jgi:hypothetical protein
MQVTEAEERLRASKIAYVELVATMTQATTVIRHQQNNNTFVARAGD